MKPTLIAMVGLPRSGKSTIVADLSAKLGAPIVRRDAIRLALHGQRFAPQAEPMVKAISLYMIRSLFLSGHETVVCDETNYSRAARSSICDPSWDTVFYPVDTPKEVCIDRAYLTGQGDLTEIIEEMAGRWERLDPGTEVFVDLSPEGTIVTRKLE